MEVERYRVCGEGSSPLERTGCVCVTVISYTPRWVLVWPCGRAGVCECGVASRVQQWQGGAQVAQERGVSWRIVVVGLRKKSLDETVEG